MRVQAREKRLIICFADTETCQYMGRHSVGQE